MPARRKTRVPKPLIVELEALSVSEELKGPARDFLKTDFSQLQRQEDFDKCFSGLLCLEQLLGPLHIRHFQTLEAMRKCLIYQHQCFLTGQQQWLERDVQSVWARVCEMLKEHLDPEIWKEVGSMMEKLFSGAPPKG